MIARQRASPFSRSQHSLDYCENNICTSVSVYWSLLCARDVGYDPRHGDSVSDSGVARLEEAHLCKQRSSRRASSTSLKYLLADSAVR